jgi:hypothetical protein
MRYIDNATLTNIWVGIVDDATKDSYVTHKNGIYMKHDFASSDINLVGQHKNEVFRVNSPNAIVMSTQVYS